MALTISRSSVVLKLAAIYLLTVSSSALADWCDNNRREILYCDCVVDTGWAVSTLELKKINLDTGALTTLQTIQTFGTASRSHTTPREERERINQEACLTAISTHRLCEVIDRR